MPWQQLTFNITSKNADACANLLSELGALSVSLQDAADEEIFQLNPEDEPLWQQVQIKALFEADVELPPIIQELTQQFQINPDHLITEHIAEQDWVRLTQEQFKAQCYANHLWVIPKHLATEFNHATQIIIDPGLAFGTGTHPTTALCLTWLAKNDVKNKVVVDYGCGSGILSLAALALGAKEVYAIDHDEQALQATKNNLALNNFDINTLKIVSPDNTPDIKADIVIANILAKPLIELKNELLSLIKPNAHLVLSGLLISDKEKIMQHYQSEVKLLNTEQLNNWLRLDFRFCRNF
jgi:ribosomal protein L11 methyltransferase